MPTYDTPFPFAAAELVVEAADGTLLLPQPILTKQRSRGVILRRMNIRPGVFKYRLQGLGQSLVPFVGTHCLGYGRVVERRGGPVLQLKVQPVEAAGGEEEEEAAEGEEGKEVEEGEEGEEGEEEAVGGSNDGWITIVSGGCGCWGFLLWSAVCCLHGASTQLPTCSVDTTKSQPSADQPSNRPTNPPQTG
jgi:hypothetical protein